MRALTYASYGDPSVMHLADVPAPTAGPGELLIRVAAAGLNPVDALQRSGAFKLLDPYEFPKIAGNELSGTVEALGPGATGFEVGQAVVARVGKSALGAIAELAAVPAEYVAPAPSSIALTDAAGLPLAGLTAQQALGPDHLDLRAGDRLLITGAAGGVGQLAVQLAALAGAHITVTASPEGADVVRALGAHDVIDHRVRRVSDGPERFDKVLDLVGGETLDDLIGSVGRGGRIVSVAGPPTPGSLGVVAEGRRRRLVAAVAERLSSRAILKAARAAGVSYEFFLMHPDGAGLAELVRLVDSGQLGLTIDSRFTLDEFAPAFERLESRRSKGKVIVEL